MTDWEQWFKENGYWPMDAQLISAEQFYQRWKARLQAELGLDVK